MRQVIFWVATVIAFTVPNYMIWQKEQIRKDAQTMLLRLAPVDPRSLIQGDYMVLDYEIARTLADQKPKPSKDGHIVVTLDQRHVARFVRIHNPNQQLKPGEYLLRYRFRKHRWRVGANAFFFQEGHRKFYERARYGEYRVTSSGNSLLVGMRDQEYKKIKPQTPQKDRP